MRYPPRNLDKNLWPESLKELPKSQVPKKLRIRGRDFDLNKKRICIIGSRQYSDYGRIVCKKIIEDLSNYPITIVSGLAYGIDSLSHQFALENKLDVIAVPGSGIIDEVIYPKRHFSLAQEILENNGCLISEFNDDQEAQHWTFPQRNRIMAGLSDLVLIIEAAEKSGTMITARLALDYNIDVGCIPGSIFNETSRGTNKLLKDGAYIISEAADILNILKIENEQTEENKLEKIKNKISKQEFKIYKLLNNPQTREQLLEKSNLEISKLNRIISVLEINDLIEFLDNKICQK